ncbi:hypothetical protein [Hyunsoonleella ulvae]|uniref:hypothetical protein n=1 Tax=Hyunsoonleella ulvae TaxID=2799948 RepID=UPI00193ABC83|nr:hypothetical protein [Hyunsoonleella ulvae]
MEELRCPNCNEIISQVEIDCENCGFPLSGTDKEKAIFIGRQISNKSKIGDAKESQEKAQRILYIIAGFQILNAILIYFKTKSVFDTSFYIILGLLLGVLGYFSSKKPILFLSLALIVILSYYGLLYFINPELVLRGILWKIIIVSFLVYGIWNSMEANKLKKENKFLEKD